MNSSIRWLIVVESPEGRREPYRLPTLGARLEFNAPDREAAEEMLLRSGIVLPDSATLTSRLEFEHIRKIGPRPPAEVRKIQRVQRRAGSDGAAA